LPSTVVITLSRVTLSAACTSPAIVVLFEVVTDPSEVTEPETVELLAMTRSPEA
jgi:hypothetical protein